MPFYFGILVTLLTLSFITRADESSISVETTTNARVTATDHLLFSNFKDPQDAESIPTNLFLHEDTVRGEYGILGGDLNFTNRYATTGDTSQNRIFTLEKKTISIVRDDWDLKFGDTNQEFGKGLALSLYNNSTFGINNTVEGVAANYHPDRFRMTAVGGRINVLKSPVAINPMPNPNPLQGRSAYLAAASVGGDLGNATKVSGHYVGVLDQTDGSGVIERNSHTVGVTFDKSLFDEVDLYAESNMLLSTKRLGGTEAEQPTGYGSYASLVWSPSPWKAKLEVKDYRKLDLDWNRVPTLEDDLIVSVHTKDVSAFRLYGERKIGQSRATVYSSYLLADDREERGIVNHPIIGTKIPLPNHAELESKAGYRWVPNHYYLMHVQGKGQLRTAPGQFIELSVRKQFGRTNLDKGELYGEEDKYVAALTYTFSEKFNATLGYEYVPTNEYAQGQHFPSVGASYRTGSLVARGFVGQTSGGPQCAGGMCRQVLAFSGAMAETTITF